MNPQLTYTRDDTTSLAERLGYNQEPQAFPSLAERLQPISNTAQPNASLGDRIAQMRSGFTTGYQNPLEYHRPEPPQGSSDILANAIAETESGNRQVKGASGEFGAFQFMPATWESISKSMEGRVLPQTPENERRVATKKINQLFERFKAQGMDDLTAARNVALVWNTSLGGSEVPLIKKGVNKQGVKYDSEAYANKVTQTYKKLAIIK